MLNASVLTVLSQFLTDTEALYLSSVDKVSRKSLSWLRELLVASVVDRRRHIAIDV